MNSKQNWLSLIALFFIAIILIVIRFFYIDRATHIFEWDALGYYIYLPSHFIYHDVAHLKWFATIAQQYHLPGSFYQASLQTNGNYVFFYTMGTAIMQAPFFFIGHLAAGWLGYAQDGFSIPYQYSVSFGLLVYVFIALYLLRKLLLTYFNDTTSALTLLLVVLATNIIQYTAIEASLTHGYLFVLCCLLLYFTARWHQQQKIATAFIIGLLIGLIAILRITDTVMIFIPILWATHTKEERKKKWLFLTENKTHLIAFTIGIIILVFIQLSYWKYATGGWVYKMGSKWDFLNPHWRVLVGFEKGWFIYTPVTLLMIVGLFFLKKVEYKRAILTYIILNTWIIIAWHEWHYAAGYSARALAESLPALAIPLGLLIDKYFKSKMKIVFGLLFAYLIAINIFQEWQYNKTIIHYDDMNRQAYAAVYLNAHPSPIDMSMLDTDERIDFSKLKLINTISITDTFHFQNPNDSVIVFQDAISSLIKNKTEKDVWLKISSQVKSDWGAYGMFTDAVIYNHQSIKRRQIRMQTAICENEKWNTIEYCFLISKQSLSDSLKTYFKSTSPQMIQDKEYKIEVYQ